MSRAARQNGCHNRAPYRASFPAQDGWFMDGVTRVPRMVSVPFRMAPECQYTTSALGQADAGCTGCRWRKEPQQEGPHT